MNISQIVEGMRQSPYVKEKELENNISSFNFTRKLFRKRNWTDMSVKARGLFIDTKNMRVKARSYNKFFNLNERRETELQNIAETWEYPIAAYVKENGYLGICSWNEDGTLFCASKSTTEGDYAKHFRKILESTLGDKIERFSRDLKKENLSAVFEVIDPLHDSHIIEYIEPKVILLDLIYNEWEPGDLDFLNKSYEVLQVWGKNYNLEIKKRAVEIWNKDELLNFCKTVQSKGYQYNGEWIEGFVLEDINMSHVKIKTDYYTFWKSWRPVITAIRKDTEVKLDKIDFKKYPESKDILWLIEKFAPRHYFINGEDMSIIILQRLYRIYKKCMED